MREFPPQTQTMPVEVAQKSKMNHQLASFTVEKKEDLGRRSQKNTRAPKRINGSTILSRE